MKEKIKYQKSRVERVCGICQKPIKKGDLYRMMRHYGRFAQANWPICEACDGGYID